MVKDCLLKTVGRKSLAQNELLTFVREARRVINSRPLAQVKQGSTDDFMALTPNHMIYGRQIEALPFGTDPIDIEDQQARPILEMWADRQKAMKEFVKLFQHQYLSGILERKKWKRLEESIRVGDLCLIHEVNSKRRDWPLGVVDEVMESRQDGLVRNVRLRVKDGYVTRSIRSLIFLRHLEDYEIPERRPEPTSDGTAELPLPDGVGPHDDPPSRVEPVRDEAEEREDEPPPATPGQPTTDEMETVVVPGSEDPLDKPSTEPLLGTQLKKRGPGRPRKTPPSAAPLEKGEGRRLRSGRVIPDPF